MVIIQIALLVYCLIEAWEEYHIIAMKNDAIRDYAFHNEWEHALSLVTYLFCAGAFVYLKGWDTWPALLTAPFIRFIFFGCLLNLLRGKSFFYLSKRGIDGFLRYTGGTHAGQFAVVVCLFAILLINLLS